MASLTRMITLALFHTSPSSFSFRSRGIHEQLGVTGRFPLPQESMPKHVNTSLLGPEMSLFLHCPGLLVSDLFAAIRTTTNPKAMLRTRSFPDRDARAELLSSTDAQCRLVTGTPATVQTPK
jgi:hypothetical protein